jgi:glutamyl/glutaminyl-tRNA synthetase
MTTRIAPTPSGFLHLGNAFSFLLTWLLVQKNKGILWLRIDDLDNERFRQAYLDDIFDNLDWLQITWDKGAKNATDFLQNYSQHLRLPHYEKALTTLISQQKIYGCQCSRQQLKNKQTCDCKNIALDTQSHTKNIAWRMAVPHNHLIDFQEVNFKNTQQSQTTSLNLYEILGDFVIRKKDNKPAYQLASVFDDALFEIDFIVRGLDLLPSTAAQIYIAKTLGQESFANIKFLHHDLLLDQNHQKLSKSANSTSLQALRKQNANPKIVYQQFATWIGYEKQATNIEKITDLLFL